MSAKNGSTRSFRLLGCLIAAALLVAAFGASAASAKKAKPPIKGTYLALGDSLAFGYSQQLYNEGVEAGFDNPQNFEAGYVNDVWNKLHGEKNGIALQNDGCPGETTESLIGPAIAKKLNETTQFAESQSKGESLPIAGVETPAAAVPNCAYQEAWHAFKSLGTGGPLHHAYVGKAQLEDAIATIATKKEEHQPVTTITLNIGPNDQLHGVKAVEKEIEAKVKAIAEHEVQVKIVEPIVKKEVEEKYVTPVVTAELEEKYIGPAVFQKCEEKAVAVTGGAEPETEEKINECLATEGEKLGGEYAAEHASDLHNKGLLLGLEYFNAHAAELNEKGHELGLQYASEHGAELLKDGEEIGHKYAFEHAAELEAEAEAKIVEAAKGEGAYVGKGLFEQIGSNLSGILYALRHGSKFGGVDYTGAIDFLSAYNPYGKLFNTAAEANTFVEAHGGLTGPFGSEDTGGLLHPAFPPLVAALAAQVEGTVSSYGGCSTNAATYFNPGNKKEPGRLQSLTNMANGTITDGKNDGPDIHATPKGYEEVSKLMLKSCSISALARKQGKKH
jgi:hypothetical protein